MSIYLQILSEWCSANHRHTFVLQSMIVHSPPVPAATYTHEADLCPNPICEHRTQTPVPVHTPSADTVPCPSDLLLNTIASPTDQPAAALP